MIKFIPGQSVKVIAPAADKSVTRIGQTGTILYTVGDGSAQAVVAFSHGGGFNPRYVVNTFSVDALEAQDVRRKAH